MKMKKLVLMCAVLAIAVVGVMSPMAVASETRAPDVELLTVLCGAVSYDMSGGDIVASSKFATSNASYFDTTGISGNFGVFGVFTYSDATSMITWAMSNPAQLVDIDIVANDLHLDGNGDCVADITDRFVLDSEDFGIANFAVSFAELAATGYTQLASNIWLDISVIDDDTVAMSLIVDGFFNQNWVDYGITNIDASILCGTLGEGIAGHRRDSGVWLTAVPEPATMALLCLGGLMLRRRK